MATQPRWGAGPRVGTSSPLQVCLPTGTFRRLGPWGGCPGHWVELRPPPLVPPDDVRSSQLLQPQMSSCGPGSPRGRTAWLESRLLRGLWPRSGGQAPVQGPHGAPHVFSSPSNAAASLPPPGACSWRGPPRLRGTTPGSQPPGQPLRHPLLFLLRTLLPSLPSARLEASHPRTWVSRAGSPGAELGRSWALGAEGRAPWGTRAGGLQGGAAGPAGDM